MNATISMDSLWAIIDSLSVKNKKWIADKLSKTLTSVASETEDEILSGIKQSVKEAKEGDTFPLDSIWSRL